MGGFFNNFSKLSIFVPLLLNLYSISMQTLPLKVKQSKLIFFFFFIADLIQCTNEMNVNIPQLADSLFERTTNSSWVVVFKSLITTHHLMVYGNEVSSIFG